MSLSRSWVWIGALGAWLLAACGASDGGPITDPETPWPSSILALGQLEEGRWRAESAIDYEVGHPLWSGGTDKDRQLLLPPGALIDDCDRRTWRFEPGTVAFKTFTADGRRLETRALRQLRAGEWDYAAYLWEETGADAALASLDSPVPLDLGGGDVHTVPDVAQCRECHDSAPSAMLGLGELQLAAARSGDDSELERLAGRGLLRCGVPDDPVHIDHPDPDTTAVLGWFAGNCVHCHNGTAAEGASFDLGPEVALANTVDHPTESSASAAGIRIMPGRPEESILYLAVSGEHDDPEVRSMPPVGVDRRDADAIARLRSMIERLAP